MKPRIFIAYRRVDSGGYARSLARELRARFGEHHVFLDVDGTWLPSGVDYVEASLEKVRECNVILALIGKQWAQSSLLTRLSDPEDLVRTEITTARDHQLRIIPVLVGGATMPPRGTLPAELGWFERLSAREISDSRWDYDVGELAREIQENINALSHAVARSRPDAEKVTGSATSMLFTLFLGLLVSIIYGLLGTLLLYVRGSKSEAQSFFVAYTSSFNTVISLGLMVGTALIIYRAQHVIPEAIEAAFSHDQLGDTKYGMYKRRLYSGNRSILLSAEFAVLGFVIFTFCQFPLSKRGEALMVIAAIVQYALGGYVARKLYYAGMMLHSLLGITVTRNLFRKRELDQINSYINNVSTLTVISVYVYFAGYYNGPFLYGSILGVGIRTFLLLPALVAMSVLFIVNFVPRVDLRKLYSRSIEFELNELRTTLQGEQLTEHQKRSHLMEVAEMYADELRYRRHVTLGDLAIGIIILIMMIQPLISR